MRLLIIPVLLAVGLGLPASDDIKDNKTIDQFYDTCVLVKSGDNVGSGVVIHNGDYEFIWTAAHVVESSEKIYEDINLQTGSNQLIIEYQKVKIVQYLYKNNNRVGENIRLATIIRFSDILNGYDLALLKTESNITSSSAKFSKNPVKVADEVFFIGSPGGISGYNSYIPGIVSACSRGIRGWDHNTNDPILNLDQYSLPICGGASGGPIFDKNTKGIVGLLVRVSKLQPTICFAVPNHVIEKFSKEAKCEWAFDTTIPVPEVFKLNCPRTSSIKKDE